MNILKTLEKEFNIQAIQVENTVKLIDEGNTIPFIARYRKELTGSLDDTVLRDLFDRLNYLRNLEERREQVRASIAEQDKLTDEISAALDKAVTLTEIDDIYRPFRPKRRTRATIAKEKGLEPLALLIWEQDTGSALEELALEYINEEKGVLSIDEAIAGAKDIIAEIISDDPEIRRLVREKTATGVIAAKLKDENEKDKFSVYEMYFDFTEPFEKIAGHRILALNRAENEGALKVVLNAPTEEITGALNFKLNKKNPRTNELICDVIDDSYGRLIAPSIERELRNELTEKAEESAIKVFASNLKQLLLQAPFKNKTVLALDPGYRTGNKLAVLDGTGKVLATDIVYCTLDHHNKDAAAEKITKLVSQFSVDIITIGNGTASRETESFVAGLLSSFSRKVYYIITNEAGASVYSASKLASEEFPEYDVALRSAVSIGRRLQDPLAELVKIDSKSIGIGQYQHDMNQKRLTEALGGVVENCVNSVGVDLNTASPSLLSFVAGINGTVAKNILKFREENGSFKNRKELLKVDKLGKKAFEQCAGFLRISGVNPLDNTGVHPESYDACAKLFVKLGFTLDDLKDKKLGGIKSKVKNIAETAEELNIGEQTLIDILSELEKPGRDPREDMPPPLLHSDVLTMEDLREGMMLSGTVRNVIDFGAFVDIGVHQDGLVHISQIVDRYIKHPLDAVKLGDIVNVKVLGVDIAKKRISLSMKGLN